MTDERKDLPPVDSPNFLERVRETLSVYLGKRGDVLDRGVTLRDLSDAGVIDVTPRYISSGRGSPVSGGGSAVEPAYVTDLTAPPTPTGFAVTAGLVNLIIQCDSQTYFVGNGHQKSRLYGATWISGALPTFSSATLLTEFVGTVAAYPTTTGTNWRLWLTWVTADGVESVVPAGGTNGISATTGKIGTTDLGPLIVEAGNLASGAVTGTKIASSAIDATKFASSIQPVTIVTGVPGTYATNTIYDTATSKIYRWNGTAYTAAVAGADIVANSITAGQIQAGAITATEIASNTITTGKLVLADINNLVPNPDFNTGSTAGWNRIIQTGGGTVSVVLASSGGVPASASTLYVLKFVHTGGTETSITAGDGNFNSAGLPGGIPITSGETFSVFLEAGGTVGTGLVIEFVTKTAAGTIAVPGAIGPTLTSAWATYSNTFTSTVTGKLYLRLGFYAGGSHTTYVTNVRLYKRMSAELIVDGAVTANKIAANAIAVGTAAVQNGAIVNAMIGSLAVDDAKIASMSVAKLTAGTIGVGEYIQSTSYVAGTSGWRIHGNGVGEFQTATVRGTVYATAGQIGGVNVDSGSIRAGQTAYNSGTGFYLGSAGNFSVGNSAGSRLTWDGTDLTVVGGGTFSGALSAASGTFAGSLSAATGTFAGSLSAATGSFAGSLSAATGTFSGNLSAAGGTFSGTLTASAVNAVDTINLAGNAVTVPVSAYTAATTTVSSATTVQSLSINALGSPVFITGCFYFDGDSGSNGAAVEVYRDATLIYSGSAPGLAGDSGGCAVAALVDTPATGSHTYTLKASSLAGTAAISNRSLTCIGIRR